MKKTLLVIASTLALSLSTSSIANTSPNWSYVQGGYTDNEVGSGFELSASRLLNDKVFLFGDYSYVSDSEMSIDMNLSQLSLGGGMRYELTTKTDLFAALSYEKVNIEIDGWGQSADEDENGFGMTVGGRSAFNEYLEAGASLALLTFDGENETKLKVFGQFSITPEFSVGISMSSMEDFDTTTVYGNFKF